MKFDLANKIMENHWVTLHTDTFLWLKNNMGFVYNANNGTRFLFTLSDRIKKICCQLQEKENLYSVELTNDDIDNNEIKEWIDSIINIQAGYLSYNVEFKKRPVSLKPILKIQDKKEYYEQQNNSGIKGEILQNLHEITFYINGSKYGSNEYYKQNIYPLKDCQILDNTKILSFIRNSQNPFLSNINLVGNIFSYHDFEKFILSISDFSFQFTIHVMAQDFLYNIKKINEINRSSNIQFNLLVDSTFDYTLLENISLPFSITAFVFSERDFLHFSDMLEAFSISRNIQILPLYNRKNLSFFESNVFMMKSDLDNINLSKNEIFMRQALNIVDFGKLTVQPDEHVFANVNKPFLGNIDDSPYSIVYKEFIEGKSWFRIRKQKPCCNCVYQWLCPSPSNYEITIGRPNLCHVKPDKS